MRNRLLAILVCIAMVLSVIPTLAFANEPAEKRYLALGDSISNGYGLADGTTPSFVYLFANDNGLVADDQYARDGLTSSGLLSMLSDDSLASAIVGADVVTVTIGSNDMLAALYGFIANAYNAAHPDEGMLAEDVQAILMGGDAEAKQALLEFVVVEIGSFAASGEAEGALAGLSSNLMAIVSQIHEYNPDVRILVANLYNPYGYLADIVAGTDYEELTQEISSAFALAADAANETIAAGAAPGGYFVADVRTAFAVAQENPCNASLGIISLNPTLIDFNLDFHPNPYGHELIAEEFTSTLHPSYAYVDVVPGRVVRRCRRLGDPERRVRRVRRCRAHGPRRRIDPRPDGGDPLEDRGQARYGRRRHTRSLPRCRPECLVCRLAFLGSRVRSAHGL